MPEAAPVTSATSPANAGGEPALRSFACSRSQYSMSNVCCWSSARQPPSASARRIDVDRVVVELLDDRRVLGACGRPRRSRAPGRAPCAAPRRAWSSVPSPRRAALEIARGSASRSRRRRARASARAWCGSRGPASPDPAAKASPHRGAARSRGTSAFVASADQRKARLRRTSLGAARRCPRAWTRRACRLSRQTRRSRPSCAAGTPPPSRRARSSARSDSRASSPKEKMPCESSTMPTVFLPRLLRKLARAIRGEIEARP